MSTWGDGWRVRVGPAEGCGPEVHASALAVRPSSDGSVVRGALVLYVESRVAAQAVIAGQDEDNVLWSDIAAWNDESDTWRVIERSGESRVVLYDWEIAKGKPSDTSTRGTIKTGGGQLTPRQWRDVLVFGGGPVAVFFAAYYLPGLAGSPQAGNGHDVSRSLFVAFLAAVLMHFVASRHRSG